MKQILIVDDEEKTRISLKQILTLEGYYVLVAENGEQALSYLRRRDISLMILDLRLSDMSGMEILEKMQEISPLTKVIIATAHASFESAVQALRYRVFEYLLKPYNPDDLIKCVKHSVVESKHATELKQQKPIAFDQYSNVYTINNEIEINIKRRVINDPQGAISLTPTEARLLEALLDRYGNLVSHVELVKEIQGYSLPRSEAAQIIRPIMCRLKSKLRQIDGADDWVLNIRGAGYLFEL